MLSTWCLELAAAPRPQKKGVRHPELIRAGPVGQLTSLRRIRLVEEFAAFVEGETGGAPILDLVRTDLPGLSGLMRDHGYNLYDSNRPVGDLKDTILGLTDAFAYARPAMNEAWRIVKTWERLEPDTARAPLPYEIYRAMRATALAWGWARIAMILHIAYFCLLRPAEIFGMRRSDVWMMPTAGCLRILSTHSRFQDLAVHGCSWRNCLPCSS